MPTIEDVLDQVLEAAALASVQPCIVCTDGHVVAGPPTLEERDGSSVLFYPVEPCKACQGDGIVGGPSSPFAAVTVLATGILAMAEAKGRGDYDRASRALDYCTRYVMATLSHDLARTGASFEELQKAISDRVEAGKALLDHKAPPEPQSGGLTPEEVEELTTTPTHSHSPSCEATHAPNCSSLESTS